MRVIFTKWHVKPASGSLTGSIISFRAIKLNARITNILRKSFVFQVDLHKQAHFYPAESRFCGCLTYIEKVEPD